MNSLLIPLSGESICGRSPAEGSIRWGPCCCNLNRCSSLALPVRQKLLKLFCYTVTNLPPLNPILYYLPKLPPSISGGGVVVDGGGACLES